MIFNFLLQKRDSLPILANSDINLIVDGDSLSVNAHTWVDPFTTYMTSHSKTFVIRNNSVGGKAMSTIINQQSINVYPYIDPTKINIVIVWEDINAILAADNANILLGRMNTYISNCYSHGVQYVISLNSYYPIMYNGSYSGWSDANSNILKDYADMMITAKYANYHVDLRTKPHIGGAIGRVVNSGDVDYPYFFNSIHYSDAGGLIACNSIINEAINKIFK